jgi:hypothetical protein
VIHGFPDVHALAVSCAQLTTYFNNSRGDPLLQRMLVSLLLFKCELCHEIIERTSRSPSFGWWTPSASCYSVLPVRPPCFIETENRSPAYAVYFYAISNFADIFVLLQIPMCVKAGSPCSFLIMASQNSARAP